MNVTTERLSDKAQTADRMKSLVRRFFRDLEAVRIRRNGRDVPILSLPLPEYFDLVKNLRYTRDDKPVEIVARPKYILALSSAGVGIDCKKKAILIAAYLHGIGLPWRFVAVSKKPSREVHHVFPQVLMAGEWLNVDATYPHYSIYNPQRVTKAEIL